MYVLCVCLEFCCKWFVCDNMILFVTGHGIWDISNGHKRWPKCVQNGCQEAHQHQQNWQNTQGTSLRDLILLCFTLLQYSLKWIFFLLMNFVNFTLSVYCSSHFLFSYLCFILCTYWIFLLCTCYISFNFCI